MSPMIRKMVFFYLLFRNAELGGSFHFRRSYSFVFVFQKGGLPSWDFLIVLTSSTSRELVCEF